MADIYDVQVALTNLAQTAIYPNGTSQPSVANCNVKIFPGWPIPASLDADLAAGNAQVSIFPTNVARQSTRFETEYYTTGIDEPTLTITLNSNTVTIGGTVTAGQACMVNVNKAAYSYLATANDTTDTIAAGLAVMIPNATVVGSVITIGGVLYYLTKAVIVNGTSVKEVAREKRLIVCYVWAPTPIIRSQIGYAIQVLFADTPRVALPDGYYGQLTYSGSDERDDLEKSIIYRRDVHFIFEFATTKIVTAPTIGKNLIYTIPSYDQVITTDHDEVVTTTGSPVIADGNH